MKRSTFGIWAIFARKRAALLVVLAAGLLAGCQTDGSGPGVAAAPATPAAQTAAVVEPAKPAETAKPAAAIKPPEAEKEPELPMTRARAATECWMKTEKSSANTDIDKRADIVTKCIDDKMKAAQAAPKN